METLLKRPAAQDLLRTEISGSRPCSSYPDCEYCGDNRTKTRKVLLINGQKSFSSYGLDKGINQHSQTNDLDSVNRESGSVLLKDIPAVARESIYEGAKPLSNEDQLFIKEVAQRTSLSINRLTFYFTLSTLTVVSLMMKA